MSRTQHPLEVYRFDDMIEEGLEVHEKTVRDLLNEILVQLKVLTHHMEIVTSSEIEQEDIKNDY